MGIHWLHEEIHGPSLASASGTPAAGRGFQGDTGRQCLDCVMDGTFPCHCHFISTKRVQSALRASALRPQPSLPLEHKQYKFTGLGRMTRSYVPSGSCRDFTQDGVSEPGTRGGG